MSEKVKKDEGMEHPQDAKKKEDALKAASNPEHEQKKKKQDHREELIKEWHEKYNELNDKYLRLYSEFDNYRKRTMKERIEMSKFASEDVIVSLLPVIDDLERALKSIIKTEDGQEVVAAEGIRLIYNKFRNLLIQKGLEDIPAFGEPFNVDYHDALTNIPATSEDMKGKVVDEIEKGYKLNGKVIRYAKVVVGI